MSRTLTKVALGATLTLIAGLGLPGSANAKAAIPDEGFCAGMSTPATPAAPPVRPTAVDDTASDIAGGLVTINVLANDTRPNPVAVITVSTPSHGDVCIDSDGQLEYFAQSSGIGYTDEFTYGITDGYHFTQARVTVTVEGILPLKAQLLRKLTSAHKAKIQFSNANARAVRVVAGDPKKRRPDVRRTLAGHASTHFKSRHSNLFYIVLIKQANGNVALVNFGRLDTRTGRGGIATLREAKALLKRWDAG